MSSRDRSELRRAALRLAIQYTALTVVLLSLAGGLVYALAAAGSREATRQTLESAVQLENVRDAPLNVFLAVYQRGRLTVSRDMPGGLPVQEALAEVAAGGGPRQDTVEAEGTTYQVLTARNRGQVVQAAVDTREARQELERLALALAGAILAAAVLAAAFSIAAARAAMQPLARALDLQRRFVADAGHELRTPLTLLSTRAQLLRRRLGGRGAEPGAGSRTGDTGAVPPDEQALAEGLDEIVADTQVLTGILQDLLVAADPRREGPTERIDLGPLARASAEAFRAEAERRGLQLTVSVPDTPVIVSGSRAGLQRVFTALLSNAVDYARSRIEVSVRREARHAVARVSDDGPGLPAELKDRVFDRFASARPAGGTGGEGAGHERHYGLGLALAAEIVARSEGSLRAEGGPGTGASLVVRLPVAAARV